MIRFEEAIQIINSNLFLMDAERVDIKECLNRVLREDIYSDMNMPPFNKSAMDGYACRREDLANELEIIEVIPAGYKPRKSIGKNQCSKIMTGAMVPEGADCVIIVEDVNKTGVDKIKYLKDKTADNTCKTGEDVKEGEKLLSAGTGINAGNIALLALSGNSSPLVSVKPKVGIISTGSEIVEPHVKPDASQIRNTNSYQLLFQCLEFGIIPSYYGIVPDAKTEIGNAIDKAKRENDIILLTGGVSMGDFDLVPDILKEKGFNILYDKIAVQPGKPAVFGRDGNKYVFGMPGNPVSSFIVFEYMVKEFLAGITGLHNYYKVIKCELADDFSRKNSSRLARIPVKINNDGKAEILEYHGSAHISAYSHADGIISIPIGVTTLKKGSIADVRQL